MRTASELIHASLYDPAKAHAYYERTKHLKGRNLGSGRPSGSGPRTVAPSGGKPNYYQSHNQSVQAQRAALEARLERLKEVLRAKVAEAKKRSGVKETSSSSSSSSSTSTSSKSSSSSSKSGGSSSDKPTASERNEKNRKARETYAKEKPPTITELQTQIRDIQRQIKAAVAQSRKRHEASNVPRTGVTPPKTADSRR